MKWNRIVFVVCFFTFVVYFPIWILFHAKRQKLEATGLTGDVNVEVSIVNLHHIKKHQENQFRISSWISNPTTLSSFQVYSDSFKDLPVKTLTQEEVRQFLHETKVDLYFQDPWMEYCMFPKPLDILTFRKRTGEVRQRLSYMLAALANGYRIAIIDFKLFDRMQPLLLPIMRESNALILSRPMDILKSEYPKECSVGIAYWLTGIPQNFTTWYVVPKTDPNDYSTQIGIHPICYLAKAQKSIDSYALLWGKKKKTCQGSKKWFQEIAFWKKLEKRVALKVKSSWCPSECPEVTDRFEDFKVECLSQMRQEDFLGVIQGAEMIFTMGENIDSPTPLDALDCGVPIVLPRKQHVLMNEISSTNSYVETITNREAMVKALERFLSLEKIPMQLKGFSPEDIQTDIQESIIKARQACKEFFAS